MSDTRTQLREYWEHLDDSHGAVSIDDVLMHGSDFDQVASAAPRLRARRWLRRSRWLRPALVFGAAFVAVGVAVGVVALVSVTREGTSPAGEQLPATTPIVPTATTITPPALQPAPPPSDSSAPVATQAPVGAVPQLPFDYETEGTPSGTSPTPLGDLSWFTLDRVSSEWTDAGFPGPYGSRPERDFWQIWADAHSGIEVFETEAGYIGLGSTAETGEPRIMLGYRNNLFRVRGPETRQEVEQWDAERGVASMEVWADGAWWAYTDDPSDWATYYFAPKEVWFSQDGSDWYEVGSLGPDEGVAMQSQPNSVAYHDGTWMLIGWDDVDEPLGYRASIDGSPAAWMSDDLVTWTRVPFDFPSSGTGTQLLRVAGGDRGWLIVAASRYGADRPTTAASLWMSSDGLAWEEILVEDITGLPGCPQFELLRRGEQCHFGGGARASFVPGGIALYFDVPDTAGVTATWRLWLGLWDGPE